MKYLNRIELARNGLFIFLDYQQPDGRIPTVICNNRLVIGTDEKPECIKPFCAQSVLLFSYGNDFSWFSSERYEQLKRYLKWYENGPRRAENGLFVWRGSYGSGMDDQVPVNPCRDPERDQRKLFAMAGPDMNAYMYREYKAMAVLAEHYGDDAEIWRQKAESLRERVNELLWNDSVGFYMTYDIEENRQIDVKHGSGLMPLWTDLPSPEQAGRIIEEHVLNAEEFWGPHGVYSIDCSHPLFQDGTVSDLKGCGCGWNGPYWVPINYVVYQAMRHHGYHEAANDLLDRQIRLVEECGDPEHNIQEYWLTDGKPGRIYPFKGWSCLIPFMALESLYHVNPTLLND